jgi:hypothetical protein
MLLGCLGGLGGVRSLVVLMISHATSCPELCVCARGCMVVSMSSHTASCPELCVLFVRMMFFYSGALVPFFLKKYPA